jgi:hypothetical protein
MSTLTGITDERVKDVRVTPETLTVSLADGRVLSVPLFWFPRLAQASASQREKWEPCGAGFGIYWPDLDEHLSVEGLLRGSPSPLFTGKATA